MQFVVEGNGGQNQAAIAVSVISEGLYKNLGVRFSAKGLGKAARVVNFVLVVWLAYSLAHFTWMLAPAPELPANAIDPDVSGSSAAKKKQGPGFEKIAAWHLFGKTTVGKPVAEQKTEAPETRLNLRLMGVLSSNEQKSARAIISDPRGEQKSYGIGALLPGDAELAEVHPDHVILLRNQRRETLRLEKRVGIGVGARSTSSPVRRKAPVRKLNKKARKVVKKYQKKLVAAPEQLVKELNLTPSLKKGKLQGFKVGPIGNQELFRTVGLRPGDIVKEVNGIPLNDSANGPKVIANLRATNHATVTVLRGNREVTVSFSLK